MTKGKAIKILKEILYQFECNVDAAQNEFAEDWQKESLDDNIEAVDALKMAIDSMKII